MRLMFSEFFRYLVKETFTLVVNLTGARNELK